MGKGDSEALRLQEASGTPASSAHIEAQPILRLMPGRRTSARGEAGQAGGVQPHRLLRSGLPHQRGGHAQQGSVALDQSKTEPRGSFTSSRRKAAEPLTRQPHATKLCLLGAQRAPVRTACDFRL